MSKFAKDLFISYAHLDNEVLPGSEEGWISSFNKSLQGYLNMRLGWEAKIWRDDRLRGNDDFAQEIEDQFPQTALLVSILSPRYLESEWCTREVVKFCDIAEQKGGLKVENSFRVFKVVKTPVEYAAMPAPLQESLDYEFYREIRGAPLELVPRGKHLDDYEEQVARLAYDMAQLIAKLDTGGGGEPEDISGKSTVYLAECSGDLAKERDQLMGDLKQHGYRVLPTRELPRNEDDYRAAVRELIEESSLSIHLVGGGYGFVPDGSTLKSGPILQNELAAERCREGGLARIIWVPGGTRTEEPKQQQFIEALQADGELLAREDLLTGDFEHLKSAVHSSLKKLAEPPPGSTGAAEGKPTIYLAQSSIDERAERATLEDELRGEGYVVLPEGPLPTDESDFVDTVKEMIGRCDLAVHLVGAGYGLVPDGPTTRSAPMIQNELAAQRSGSEVLARIIWLPEGTRSEEPLQQRFIEALSEDSEVRAGADLVTQGMEELKNTIRSALEKLEEPEEESAHGGEGEEATVGKMVYVVCTEEDRKATVPLRKFIRSLGFEAKLPIFEGDAAAIRGAHERLLGTCEAVILYCGAGDELWKRTQDSDLKRIAAYREGRPLPGRATCVADPRTGYKEDLIDMEEEPNLMEGFGEFDESRVAALVEMLKDGVGTP